MRMPGAVIAPISSAFRGCLSPSADCQADAFKALPHRVRIPRQHRLYAMPRDLGQVGVVDAGGAEVGDVAALVGADV